MKTIDMLINEIKSCEELQKLLADAAKNNALDTFLRAATTTPRNLSPRSRRRANSWMTTRWTLSPAARTTEILSSP